MRFAYPQCPKCGADPFRAEHSTLGSHSLSKYEEADGGHYEWGDDRKDSAECDESTCIGEAQARVYSAACKIADSLSMTSASMAADLVLFIRVRDLVAAVEEARSHGAGCIVLWCGECAEQWHTKVVEEAT